MLSMWSGGSLQKGLSSCDEEEQKQEAKPVLVRAFAISQADAAASPSVVAVVIDFSRPETFGSKVVRVVREFLGVVSKELVGLMSQQEIDFTIDLAPGEELVPKAQYRMAPADLRELKK
uniref:Uncharacterized protein n=1 Tax=Cannabis sativa TaxID=3483 RepID=A0A803PKH4_CANSA